MIENKQTYDPKSLLSRKKLYEQQLNENYNKLASSHLIRQGILLSRGDSLTDEDLINHRRDVRLRKLAKLAFVIPFLEYYFIGMKRGFLISIPITMAVYYKLHNLSFSKTEYTYGFSEKAMLEHVSIAANFNLMRIGTPDDRWTKNNAILYDQWLARNEYK